MTAQQTGRRRPSERGREPAAAHFKRLVGLDSARCPDIGGASCTFEVYRADEARVSSTRFVGGDWHWRLLDGEGLILLDTGGYASEGQCIAAIGILQLNAGFARLSRSD